MTNYIDLSNWRINEIAYPQEEALKVLSTIKQECIPVLGGDVLTIINGIPTYTYDGWSCNRNENETLKDYVERSYNVAYKYISQYHSKSNDNYLFTIIHSLSVLDS